MPVDYESAQETDFDGAATYTHIHAFLVKQKHKKAADVLRKAVKEVVVLKEDVKMNGPSLDAIIKEWQDLKAKGDESSSSCVSVPCLVRTVSYNRPLHVIPAPIARTRTQTQTQTVRPG